MKKQIACPECKGNGSIVLAKAIDDYCGIGSKMCPCCDGTGLQEADVTYADRIRAKISSDEGIADILLALDITLAEEGKEFTRLYCHGDNGCVDENDDITCNDEMRKNCILRWLRQPADEV